MKRLLLTGTIVFGVMLALAACTTENKEARPLSSSVTVNLKEWSVTPNVLSAAAGDVTFVASNTGSIPHELVIIKTDLPFDALVVEPAQGNQDGYVNELSSGLPIGEIEDADLDPGQSHSTTFNLSAGQYVLICNLPGHYGAGMRVGLDVR